MMLTRSWSIWSSAVMTRDEDWKPRCARMTFVNCCARSTFEPSSVPVLTDPRPFSFGRPTMASPELELGAPEILALALQAAGVGEAREGQLADRLVRAIRVDPGHLAGAPDREAHERAGRGAGLALKVLLIRPGELGEGANVDAEGQRVRGAGPEACKAHRQDAVRLRRCPGRVYLATRVEGQRLRGRCHRRVVHQSIR